MQMLDDISKRVAIEDFVKRYEKLIDINLIV